MLRPAMSTWPRVGRSAKNISLSSVDLPAPEGPVRKTNSALAMSKFTSTKTGGSPWYDFVTWNI